MLFGEIDCREGLVPCGSFAVNRNPGIGLVVSLVSDEIIKAMTVIECLGLISSMAGTVVGSAVELEGNAWILGESIVDNATLGSSQLVAVVAGIGRG